MCSAWGTWCACVYLVCIHTIYTCTYSLWINTDLRVTCLWCTHPHCWCTSCCHIKEYLFMWSIIVVEWSTQHILLKSWSTDQDELQAPKFNELAYSLRKQGGVATIHLWTKKWSFRRERIRHIFHWSNISVLVGNTSCNRQHNVTNPWSINPPPPPPPPHAYRCRLGPDHSIHHECKSL